MSQTVVAAASDQPRAHFSHESQSVVIALVEIPLKDQKKVGPASFQFGGAWLSCYLFLYHSNIFHIK